MPHRKHTAFEWIGIESMDEPQQTTHNHTHSVGGDWQRHKVDVEAKEGAHSSINTSTTMPCVCEHHLVSWCSHKGDMVTTWQTHHMEGKGDCTHQSTMWHPTMAHISPPPSTNKWIATTRGHHQQHHTHQTQCVHNHPILHHFCVCSTVWCCCVTTHQNHSQAFFTSFWGE